MKYYLSSFKLGNEAEKLKTMVTPENRKAAYIPNAIDVVNDPDRRTQHEESDMNELHALGFTVERLDLREYFDAPDALETRLREYGLLWVSGGNTFALRQAMRLSGFDELIHKLKDIDIVYGGYSAGVCVLAPTLKGLHIVDPPDVRPYGEEYETIWEGLGILDYSVAPHYDSDHPESDLINQEIQYCIDHGMPYKPLRDGEVIIIE